MFTNSNEKKTCLLLCLLCIFKFQTLACQNFWIFYFTPRLTLYECVVNVCIQREFLIWNWTIIDLFYCSNLHCKYCLCTKIEDIYKQFCCAKNWVWKLTKYNLKFWDDLSNEYQHWVHHTCTKKTNFSQCEETCLLLFDSTLGLYNTTIFIGLVYWKQVHSLKKVSSISDK